MKYSTKDKKTLMKMLSVILEDNQDGIEWMDVTLDWDIVNDDSEIPPYYVPIKTTRYRINVMVERDTEL